MRASLLFPILLTLFGLTACDDSPAESPRSDTVSAVEDSGIALSSGPLGISIDPQLGGRITSFTYEGREILKTDRDADHLQWGSTVWPSPQSDWNWPPPAVFDTRPYEITRRDSNQVMLISGIDSVSSLQFTKAVRLTKDERWGHVATLMYRIYNRADVARTVAVWENTRVPFSGVIRVPAGSDLRLSDPERSVSTQTEDDQILIELSDRQPNKQKLFYDVPEAEGDYVSHSYARDGLVFQKSWRRPARVAPEQARLELYFAPENGFAELEVQGEYRTIAPGGHVKLSVLWQLRPE